MRSTALLLPFALAALPFLACSSDKNHAERDAAPEAAGLHPDYASMTADQLKAEPIGQGKPDLGSKPVDIAKAERGFQFAWLWDLDPGLGHEGKAWATFTYDDNTSDFVLPVRVPSMTGFGWGGWEPFSDPVPLEQQGPAWAVRFKGGPFTEYGGGFGMSLRSTSNNLGARPMTAGIQLLEATPSAEFPTPTAGAYDVSTYDGLAIWVRRGPEGQSTMRIGITERNSAEDLNSSAIPDSPPGVFEGKYCKRWRYCGCSGGTPCSPVPGNPDKHVCYDPSLETPTAAELGDQIKYPHCGTTRCQDLNSSTAGSDPLFWKNPPTGPAMCSPAVQSDGHTDMFCYDPAIDPPPPAKRERCNNPFSRAFTVTTNWQLIKVPFSELRQADEASVAGEMDLKSVKQFVVTYSGGWADFWVANVGFYRAQ